MDIVLNGHYTHIESGESVVVIAVNNLISSVIVRVARGESVTPILLPDFKRLYRLEA